MSASSIETDTVAVADAVRVLGVLITPDLSLEKHATSVSTKCFHQLRQLRRVRRSLERDSAATLVHAFVTIHIDYGNTVCKCTENLRSESSAAHENSTVV